MRNSSNMSKYCHFIALINFGSWIWGCIRNKWHQIVGPSLTVCKSCRSETKHTPWTSRQYFCYTHKKTSLLCQTCSGCQKSKCTRCARGKYDSFVWGLSSAAHVTSADKTPLSGSLRHKYYRDSSLVWLPHGQPSLSAKFMYCLGYSLICGRHIWKPPKLKTDIIRSVSISLHLQFPLCPNASLLAAFPEMNSKREEERRMGF